MHARKLSAVILPGRAGPDRYAKGRIAEDAVADYLFVRGFRVTGRNVRFGPLEIDIIAERGPLVVLVEVRMRGPGALHSALSSITREKRRNLIRAARKLWVTHLRARREISRFRIDVAAVDLADNSATVTYIEGAIVDDGRS